MLHRSSVMPSRRCDRKRWGRSHRTAGLRHGRRRPGDAVLPTNDSGGNAKQRRGSKLRNRQGTTTTSSLEDGDELHGRPRCPARGTHAQIKNGEWASVPKACVAKKWWVENSRKRGVPRQGFVITEDEQPICHARRRHRTHLITTANRRDGVRRQGIQPPMADPDCSAFGW